MTNAPKPIDRRRLIVGAGAIVVIGYAGFQAGWIQRFLPAPSLPFQDIKAPAGYRLLTGGAISGGQDPFIGLGDEPPAELLAAEAWARDNLCSALYRDVTRSGTVPVAYFFDYQCPICRRLTPRLRALSGVSIVWHDLAALGPGSEMAARASIAAGFQGAYDAFHDRLMRARFQANEGYIGALAESVGIDPAQLIADMQSPAVIDQMWRSRAAANLFGMLGTPGMVVGRTVVIGDISNRDLEWVIADEAASDSGCRAG